MVEIHSFFTFPTNVYWVVLCARCYMFGSQKILCWWGVDTRFLGCGFEKWAKLGNQCLLSAVFLWTLQIWGCFKLFIQEDSAGLVKSAQRTAHQCAQCAIKQACLGHEEAELEWCWTNALMSILYIFFIVFLFLMLVLG